MAGRRTRAMQERWHLILTVWPSAEARDSGGWALRVASGVLSSAGSTLQVNIQGVDHSYPPALDPSSSVTDALSMAGQSFSAEVPWLWDGLSPRDVDLSRGVGEVAVIWETSNGTALDPWERREVRVSGDVTQWEWGDDHEACRVTIQDVGEVDSGDFWPDGAELDAERFGDLDDTGDRDIAPQAAGYLPPRVYAPVGSDAFAPMPCVFDEVDAVTGVSNLVPRRYHAGSRRPGSVGSSHQIQVVHPSKDGFFMASGSSDYQVAPTSGTDDLGDPYWYFAGDFDEAFGTASVTFTNGSPNVTATLVGGLLAVGDQIKASTGGADDYLRIVNLDGSAITLSGNYGGATSTNGTGNVIRTPPKRAYPAYRRLDYGGDCLVDAYGVTNAPITGVVDILVDALKDARLPLPLMLDDIEAMRPRVLGLDLTAVITQRQSPFGWASSRVFDWLPIRPYRDGGRIRFAWVGPVTEEEIVTEIDLDSIGGMVRVQPISWLSGETFPVSRVRYFWDVFRNKYGATVASDASAPLFNGGPRGARVATGRALAAQADYRGQARAPAVEREYDAIESRTVAGVASSWLLYRWGMRRQGIQVEVARDLSYLAPGDCLRITETGVTRRSQVWRVEMRTMAPVGGASLVCESVAI